MSTTSLAERPLAAGASQARRERAVALWLLLSAAMVFAMAVIGAVTRLTDSGLSIMEWAPLSGAIPPLSQGEWERLFALYREIPQYRLRNAGMTLAEFQTIFWWEWVHRLWGRLIGLVFLLPFLWFWFTGRIRRPLLPHLLLVFLLGAAQGALGWFMVASGFLPDRLSVSQYRLAAHLGLAVAIYGYLLWLAFGLCLRRGGAGSLGPWTNRGLNLLLLLAPATLLSGAFVAGLDAGLTYNSFPLMDGRLIPEGYRQVSPFIANFFESIPAVQFNHRLLAVLTLLLALALWGGIWRDRAQGGGLLLGLVAASSVLQVALGIATLLLVVPVALAAAHQGGALLVIGLLLLARYRLSGPSA